MTNVRYSKTKGEGGYVFFKSNISDYKKDEILNYLQKQMDDDTSLSILNKNRERLNLDSNCKQTYQNQEVSMLLIDGVASDIYTSAQYNNMYLVSYKEKEFFCLPLSKNVYEIQKITRDVQKSIDLVNSMEDVAAFEFVKINKWISLRCQ